MKKNLIVSLLTFVLLAVIAPLVAQAQYVVKASDDNLWDIAEKNMNAATAWKKIYDANAFLHEPGRRFVDRSGRTIVIIHEGEVLAGVNNDGIVSMPPVVNTLPIELGVNKSSNNPNLVVLLVAFVLALVWFIGYLQRKKEEKRERELNQNPITSGPPVIEGGVTNATVSEAFQSMAARQWQAETGRIPSSVNVFTILNSTPGRGWGIMEVSYADGRQVERLLNGERVYEAIVQFPDGNEETLYMLQACGNDLRFGDVEHYGVNEEFRFEADVVAVSDSAEVAQEPVIVASTTATETSRRSLSYVPANHNGPSMVRSRGLDFHSLDIEADGTRVLRFSEA